MPPETLSRRTDLDPGVVVNYGHWPVVPKAEVAKYSQQNTEADGTIVAEAESGDAGFMEAREMSAYSNAKPSNLDRDVIEGLGEDFGKLYRLDERSARDVVRDLGGELLVRDYMTSDATGSIYIESDGSFRVFVPKHTSAIEDRFTIAHEIGHLVLHHMWPKHNGDDPGRVTADRYGEGRAEDEANWFASAFLMPTDVVHRRLGELKSIPMLAAELGVPLTACAHRLKRLGLAEDEEVAPLDPAPEPAAS